HNLGAPCARAPRPLLLIRGRMFYRTAHHADSSTCRPRVTYGRSDDMKGKKRPTDKAAQPTSPEPVSRRSFLKGVGAATALTVAGCGSSMASGSSTQPTKIPTAPPTATEVPTPTATATPGASADVIVVGGGFAGVSAAYELEQQGASVILLEARDRV